MASSGGEPEPWRKTRFVPRNTALSQVKGCPLIMPERGRRDMMAALGSSVQAGTLGFFSFSSNRTWLSSTSFFLVDQSFSPKNANPKAQTVPATRKPAAYPHSCRLAVRVGAANGPLTTVFGFPACTADMMSLDSPEAGAWGTTIARKQVGHSMAAPLFPGDAVRCWPQTGQANLNSLILFDQASIQMLSRQTLFAVTLGHARTMLAR